VEVVIERKAGQGACDMKIPSALVGWRLGAVERYGQSKCMFPVLQRWTVGRYFGHFEGEPSAITVEPTDRYAFTGGG